MQENPIDSLRTFVIFCTNFRGTIADLLQLVMPRDVSAIVYSCLPMTSNY